MGRNYLLIIIILFSITAPVLAQVYNYEPISFYTIESNPSALTSGRTDRVFKFVQKNSLSNKTPFSYTQASYSSHLNSNFFGVGLTLNNTYQGKGVSYQYAALGVGYRNVILNKTLLKVGATYKTILSHNGGKFEYYKSSVNSSATSDRITEKLNLAVSLTGNSERFYIALSSLNLDLPWSKSHEEIEFSRYYFFNVGNFASIFDRADIREISYAGMSRYDAGKDKWVLSHYLNLKYHMPITRRHSLFLGSRTGYLDQTDIHIMPFVTLFSEHYTVSFMYNFHLDDSNFNVSKISTIQTSILFKL